MKIYDICKLNDRSVEIKMKFYETNDKATDRFSATSCLEVGQIIINILYRKRFLRKLIIIFGNGWGVGANADTQINRGSGLQRNISLQVKKIVHFLPSVKQKTASI